MQIRAAFRRWTERVQSRRSAIALLALVTPFVMLVDVQTAGAGVNVWTTNGAGGGNITSIAIDPVHPTTVYAACGHYPNAISVGGAGGIFKSDDGGLSWTGISAGLLSPYVSGLVIDPSTSMTLYAGTDAGVAKTTDGGLHWKSAGLIDTQITAIAVDPTDPTTLYAGTEGIVFKSTDGGLTWTANAVPDGLGVLSLAVDPRSPTIIFAGTNGIEDDNHNVLRSLDAGRSWQRVGSDFYLMYSLAIDPTTSVVYSGGIGGVIKSADHGNTWTRTYTSGGAQVFSIAIDPTAPSTVYIGTVQGILKSVDYGTSWDLYDFNNGFQPGNGFIFSLAIDPVTPAIVYAGMDANLCNGLYKSTDSGANWIPVGLANSAILRLAIASRAPSTIYAGYECDGLIKSTDSGRTWSRADAGIPPSGSYTRPTITALTTDPANVDVLYTATDTGIFKSIDAGASWRDLGNGFGANTLVIDPSDPETLYATAASRGAFYPQNLWKSTDGGTTWTFLHNGFLADTIAIDPQRPATLYAGVGGQTLAPGAIFKSTNGGMDWTESNTPQTFARDAWVAAIVVDRKNPDTVYVVTRSDYSGGIFKSTDAGANWERAVTSPPAIYSLTIDPADSGTLYAASTDSGVIRSVDGGSTWTDFNHGLIDAGASVVVTDLQIPATLYAAVGYGGGVFSLRPVVVSSMCAGDCDGAGAVTIENLLTIVDIALGSEQESACLNGVPTGDSKFDISLIVSAVNNALNGCPS